MKKHVASEPHDTLEEMCKSETLRQHLLDEMELFGKQVSVWTRRMNAKSYQNRRNSAHSSVSKSSTSSTSCSLLKTTSSHQRSRANDRNYAPSTRTLFRNSTLTTSSNALCRRSVVAVLCVKLQGSFHCQNTLPRKSNAIERDLRMLIVFENRAELCSFERFRRRESTQVSTIHTTNDTLACRK